MPCFLRAGLFASFAEHKSPESFQELTRYQDQWILIPGLGQLPGLQRAARQDQTWARPAGKEAGRGVGELGRSWRGS